LSDAELCRIVAYRRSHGRGLDLRRHLLAGTLTGVVAASAGCTALGGGPDGESHPYSEAYRAVLKRLHERHYIKGNVRKDADAVDDGWEMVRCDGVYYDCRLRFVRTSR